MFLDWEKQHGIDVFTDENDAFSRFNDHHDVVYSGTTNVFQTIDDPI